MLAEIYDVARRSYRFNHLREGRRAVVFMLRAALHWNKLRELYQFFHKNKVRAEL